MTQTSTHTTIDTTHTVRSTDGATISYLSMGSGPALLVIPGALALAADYLAFAHAMADRFTVHIVERRGRGHSSPQGDDYSVDKERMDVLALQQKTGASFLVGHSFGGLVALEAARNNPGLAKLAVYEPGVSIAGSIPMDWMPAYEQKLGEKKYYDALVAFSLGTGPDRARNTPHWLMKLLLPLFLSARERQQMLGLLRENLREHRELARLDSCMGGENRSTWVDQAIEQLATVLPHAETKAFPTLNHFGINKGSPREVAKAIGNYCLP